MASTSCLLQFIAAVVAHQHASGPGDEAERCDMPYTGALAELPPIHPVLFDPEPPVWFIRLAICMAKSGSEDLDVLKEWAEFQLQAKARFEEREAECRGLLCDHYGIDIGTSDAGWRLAMALARQHVPAFQLERAVDKQRERRAKKPTKLDVEGSLYLFLCDYLDNVSKMRALGAVEKSYLQKWGKEVKARGSCTTNH